MSPVAGDFDYETGGTGYALRRRADPRIEALVHAALGEAGSVVNVGAGAGSYEPTDRQVLAIEPSEAMRVQRPSALTRAVPGIAEQLPLRDDAVDAAMATVTIHQWRDTDRGLQELRRVSRGPVVILTFEGEALDRLWLGEYAPELFVAERARYPAVDHVVEVLGGTATVMAVPVPIDCTDGFTEAFYARPEAFLDPAVRRSQSAWGFVDAGAADRAVARLGADLASGAWDRRHGHLRDEPTFVGALRLIVASP
jgi:SAM-dependent methyltransferase